MTIFNHFQNLNLCLISDQGAVSDNVSHDPDNEVPIVHESHNPKVTSQPKLPEQKTESENVTKVDDVKSSVNANVSSNSSVNPQKNETVPSIINEHANKTSDHVKNAENLPEKPTVKPEENNHDQGKKVTEAAKNVVEPTVKNNNDSFDAKDQTLLPEDKDVETNNESDVSNSTKVTNSTDTEGNLKPDVDKTTQKSVVSQVTSPLLSNESSNTENSPTEYFATLNPKGVDTESASGFSFFRLFILATVAFFILYVGYYYRHKIKRHFGNHGNEIYYHPLRTMQHNAVD